MKRTRSIRQLKKRFLQFSICALCLILSSLLLVGCDRGLDPTTIESTESLAVSDTTPISSATADVSLTGTQTNSDPETVMTEPPVTTEVHKDPVSITEDKEDAEKPDMFYYDFTGDGCLDTLSIRTNEKTLAEYAAITDGASNKKHTIVNSKAVESVYTSEKVSDGWRFTVDGKSAYVMTGAFAKDEKLYDSPRLSTVPYYITEYSDDPQASFCTGDYSLKRCYDIYLGDDSICGAICESLTFANGEFIPTKWEFICSPNSTYVAIKDWPKKYSESFMPEEAASLLCQGSSLGREVLLFSYCRKDPIYSIYANSIVFISYDKGASYIEFEIPVPENFKYTRVVDILSAASAEVRVVFKSSSHYTELLYQLGGYLWQWPLYPTGDFKEVVPSTDAYDSWEEATDAEVTPKRVWHDFTGDGYDEVITFLPSPNESGEIGYVYDPIREEQQILKNRIDEDIIQYERTEWGWKAKINNEIIYIRTDDLKTEEPLLNQPKAVLVNAYVFEPDVTSNKVALQCIYNLYATKSTLVGAIYETYTYQDGKLTPIIWEYGESPSIEGPQYQKHSEEYIYSFLPEGAVAPIASGAPVGNVPTVISYDSDNGEPLLYYTYDNGMTFLPLALEMPDGVSYDSARVVDIGAGNSRELYLDVEFVRDGHKEYYEILYDYYNEYADGRFRPYGEWKKGKEEVYYDFTGDTYLDHLNVISTNDDVHAWVVSGKGIQTYSVEADRRYVEEKFSALAVDDGWKFTVDGRSSYVMTGAFAKDENLYETPKLSATPYYITEYSDDPQASFYTGDYSLKRCYDIYLGDDSICGAICESLTFANGEFVPSKWEFVCSPNSTFVPVQDRAQNYPDTFLPDGAYAVACRGSVLGSGIPTFISYKVSGSVPSFYMSEGYGAVYFPIELDIAGRSDTMAQVTEIIEGNSTEISLVFTTGEETFTVDCLVMNYLWQSSLVLH